MLDWLRTRLIRRSPDVIIGGFEDPYLLRWHVIPRNPLFNIYYHVFLRSDDDRALHDHPWLFNISYLNRGTYTEHEITRGGTHEATVYSQRDIKFRWGRAPHRLELHDGKLKCETLFITGPNIREWGFYCPKEWRHWKVFSAVEDASLHSTSGVERSVRIGRGCD